MLEFLARTFTFLILIVAIVEILNAMLWSGRSELQQDRPPYCIDGLYRPFHDI